MSLYSQSHSLPCAPTFTQSHSPHVSLHPQSHSPRVHPHLHTLTHSDISVCPVLHTHSHSCLHTHTLMPPTPSREESLALAQRGVWPRPRFTSSLRVSGIGGHFSKLPQLRDRRATTPHRLYPSRVTPLGAVRSSAVRATWARGLPRAPSPTLHAPRLSSLRLLAGATWREPSWGEHRGRV